MLQNKNTNTDRPEFSLAQARYLIRDLFTPNARIYWADFLLSWLFGSACFVVVRRIWESDVGGFWYKVGLSAAPFVLNGLLYYRASLFIHELTHLRSGTYRGFRLVWNLLCGIPFLVPSFVYYSHADHHRRKRYGTVLDGEYVSFGHKSPLSIILFLATSFLIPPLAVFRFLVLTPLSWFSPWLRRWVHQHASSLVIDPTYIRPMPTKQLVWSIRLQEAACFLWLVAIIATAWVGFHRLPYPLMIQGYSLGVFIIMLNAIRTLGAHRYYHAGEELTFLEQFRDSLNFPHRPLITELWGPTGTRYHALHHLFPSLPYHAMPEAHRRLMRELPADSIYRETEEATLTAALRDLWRRANAFAARGEKVKTEPVGNTPAN